MSSSRSTLDLPTSALLPDLSGKQSLLMPMGHIPADIQLALLSYVITRAERFRRTFDNDVLLELTAIGIKVEHLDWLLNTPWLHLRNAIDADHAELPIFAVSVHQENLNTMIRNIDAKRNPNAYTRLLYEFLDRGASNSMLRKYFNLSEKKVPQMRKERGISSAAGREPLPTDAMQNFLFENWFSKNAPTDERERLVWLHERCTHTLSLSVIYTVLSSTLGDAP